MTDGSFEALLDHWFSQRRADVAFIEGATGESLSWAGLAAIADDWRKQLPDLVPGGQRVGILAESPLSMVACLIGCLACGVAAAPLNPGATAGELKAAVENLGLGLVVADSVLVERMTDCLPTCPVVALGDSGRLERPVASGPVWPVASELVDTPQDVRVILSSSGTTGPPKIIGLSEAQLLAGAAAVVEHHRLGVNDRGYCTLPLFHINAMVVGVLSTLVGGGSMVLDRRFSRAAYWPVVERFAVTWLNAVPALFAILVEAPPPDPELAGQVRFARSASAPLAIATLRRFEEHCRISVVETYGMTEATGQITTNPLAAEGHRPGSVGLAAGVDLRVSGPGGAAVAPGEIGEIRIAGPQVIEHYLAPRGRGWGRRARDADGWLATGDLGFADPEGYLYLVGRRDDVINRGGEKIYPGEVEAVLLADSRVHAAVVVGRRHPVLGEEPVAYVLASERLGGPCRAVPADRRGDGHRLVKDLKRMCAAQLSRYKRPVDIVLIDDLPFGATGKIRRSEVRRLSHQASLPGATSPDLSLLKG
jgi:acyl-CoA synthetase (AMP-forming)/AMP-acid ligase II